MNEHTVEGEWIEIVPELALMIKDKEIVYSRLSPHLFGVLEEEMELINKTLVYVKQKESEYGELTYELLIKCNNCSNEFMIVINEELLNVDEIECDNCIGGIVK